MRRRGRTANAVQEEQSDTRTVAACSVTVYASLIQCRPYVLYIGRYRCMASLLALGQGAAGVRPK